MKKIIKFWDIVLIAILGLFATACNITDPPPAEYGAQPEYGVPSSVHVDLESTQTFE